ncbi:MAG: hypothetical protein CSA18_03885 [Deltaproteobacteria bacterium]|nr:MAG: hypothetical protein CSB21_00485 [Deltaproteobacteria bacterium]PIE74699.1 MAG: hypothetical protein CSA18_03885 [Deltaproteobacteria bacterium]
MSERNYNKKIVFFLFFSVVFLIYSNTFNSSWHFDDYDNIILNTKIQIDNLYPETIKKTFFASVDGKNKMYRPAAMFSLALNWYFGKENVFGYHLVNIMIHVFAGYFLFLTFLKLFETPALKDNYNEIQAFNISLIASVLWVIHPIQTQAVTYIVQRMASMAALFYILSLLFYFKARFSKIGKKMIYNMLFAIIFYILAVLSKQNAAILPLILVFIELIFFRQYEKINIKQIFFIFIFCLSIGLVWLFIFGIHSIDYSFRTFTLGERLLTEPRIVINYLYKIFYPLSTQYSLVNDIEVSRSLFYPLTTFFSILFVSCLVGFSFFCFRKYPLTAFAILFFFSNHIIESSIFPLELIYEHRNYLPSMFLFIPLAVLINYSIEYYKNKKLLFSLLIISYCFLFIFTGIGTYTRNFDWLTEKTLWEDSLAKAPNSARSYHNFGNFFINTGDYDKAEGLYKKSIGLYDSTKNKDKLISYNGLACINEKRKNYKKTVFYSEKALELFPNNSAYRFKYIEALEKNKEYEKAHKKLSEFEEDSLNEDLRNMKTYILLRLKKGKESQKNAIKTLKKHPGNAMALYLFGLSCFQNKSYEKAKHFLTLSKRYRSKIDDSFLMDLCLYQISLNENDKFGASDLLEKIVGRYNLKYIKDKLNKMKESEDNLVDIPAEKILNDIKEYI